MSVHNTIVLGFAIAFLIAGMGAPFDMAVAGGIGTILAVCIVWLIGQLIVKPK